MEGYFSISTDALSLVQWLERGEWVELLCSVLTSLPFTLNRELE